MKSKKIFSIFLTLIMVFTLIPVSPTFAAGTSIGLADDNGDNLVPGDTVTVNITDLSSNTDSNTQEEYNVSISNGGSGSITIKATEDGQDSSDFIGTFTLAKETDDTNNELKAISGDTITAEFVGSSTVTDNISVATDSSAPISSGVPSGNIDVSVGETYQLDLEAIYTDDFDLSSELTYIIGSNDGNSTASLNGNTLEYTPSGADVGNVVNISFKAEDSAGNLSGEPTIHLNVTKDTPVEDTNNPISATAIDHGDTLSSSILSGSFKDSSGTSVAGSLSWDDTVTSFSSTGNRSWTFVPSDTTTYNNATGTVEVVVNKSLASFDPVTLTQTGTVADGDVQYTNASDVDNALPSEVEVTLEDMSTANVPVMWGNTDTYDSSTAGDYTFTGTWGMMPTGVDNNDSLAAPTVEVTVEAGSLSSDTTLTSNNSDIVTVTAGDELEAVALTQVQDFVNALDAPTNGSFELQDTLGDPVTIDTGLSNMIEGAMRVLVTAEDSTLKGYQISNDMLLGGSINIIGDAKYGTSLNAGIGDLQFNGSTNKLSYSWTRSGSEVDTGSTYTLVEADIGSTLKVEVTSSLDNGTIEATTATVEKADGAAAPTVVNSANDVDNEILVEGGEGKVTVNIGTNITGDYEYRTNTDSTWYDLPTDEITGLTSSVVGIDIRKKETATTKAGTVTSTSVTVTDAATTAVTGVDIDGANITLQSGGSTSTLTETVSPSDATDKSVTWISSDTGVATVSDGVVTPVSEGTATITVETVDGGFTDTCNVTVNPSTTTEITVSNDSRVSLDTDNSKLYVEDGTTIISLANLMNMVNGSQYQILDQDDSPISVSGDNVTGDMKVKITSESGTNTQIYNIDLGIPSQSHQITKEIAGPFTEEDVTLTTSVETAEVGNTVTVNVSDIPAGYEFLDLFIKDNSNSGLDDVTEVTKGSEYTFTMIDEEVKVELFIDQIPGHLQALEDNIEPNTLVVGDYLFELEHDSYTLNNFLTAAGTVHYNGSRNEIYYYTGTDWYDLVEAENNGGGLDNPINIEDINGPNEPIITHANMQELTGDPQ